MPTVEIILLKYKNPKMGKACVESILKHTKIPYTLRVYDNETYNDNIGCMWNRLIGTSWAEYICLLNTDTLVEPKWLERLLSTFDEHKDCGVVGPITNSSGNPQQDLKRSDKVFSYTERYGKSATLCGFCLLFPKKVWEEVGGFPENFGFYGQEDVFLAKISRKDYSQYVRQDVFIYHYGSASAKLAEKRGEIDIKKELKEARAHRDACFEAMKKGQI